jgi:hypothetical protein
MKEPDALEGEAGKHPILVVEEREQLVQLGHCAGEFDLLYALGSELLKEKLVPILGSQLLPLAILVNSPQREVWIFLCKMAPQWLNLLARRARR